MANVLERGNIYFVYRPKVEHTSAAGLEDIQRFFVLCARVPASGADACGRRDPSDDAGGPD
jgi:hypothetical protein